MKKAVEITAPQSLGSFFADSSDEEQEFEQLYEEQNISICGKDLIIRQFCWHKANANKVWPGTFNLASFINNHETHYNSGKIIELGAATGALSIFLIKQCSDYNIITSDIDDDGDVESNILFNFTRNDLEPVIHVPFTWGTPWPVALANPKDCKYIIASDILLYVSVYPALVSSLEYLFAEGVVEFVMSWNRRIAESASFFAQMATAGFHVYHHGECVYSFYRDVVPPHVVSTVLATVATADATNTLPASVFDLPTVCTTSTDATPTATEEKEEDRVMAEAIAAEKELANLSPEERALLESELAAEIAEEN